MDSLIILALLVFLCRPMLGRRVFDSIRREWNQFISSVKKDD